MSQVDGIPAMERDAVAEVSVLEEGSSETTRVAGAGGASGELTVSDGSEESFDDSSGLGIFASPLGANPLGISPNSSLFFSAHAMKTSAAAFMRVL